MNSKEDLSFKEGHVISLGIVAYEGIELLPSILYELKGVVDHAIIAIQNVSYHGDPISEKNKLAAYGLVDAGLVDEVIEIDLDTNLEARVQETNKRNYIIRYLHEKYNSDYVHVIDSDEFYTRESYIAGAKHVLENDIHLSYCRYLNYYHDTMHYLKYPFQEMYVPFLCKVLDDGSGYFCAFETLDFNHPSDPTRRYARPGTVLGTRKINGTDVEIKKDYTVDFTILPYNMIRMHHLSWVRASIRGKLEAWSSKRLFKDWPDLLDKAVYDFDSFDFDNPKPAHLLFNTINNQVDVVKFDKPYIHLHYDYKNCLPEIYEQKQILILVCTCDKELFNREEIAIRNTWGDQNDKYPNIRVVYIKEKPDLDVMNPVVADWNTNTVYVRTQGDLQHTSEKLYLAYNYITNKTNLKFDYVVKTNTSTYINLGLLDLFVGYLDNDVTNYCGEAIAAYWTMYNYIPCGNLTITPRRNYDLIFKGDIKQAMNLFTNKHLYDDVMYGLLYNKRLEKLGIPYHTHLSTIGIKHNFGEEYIDEDVKNYIGIQVKDVSGKEFERFADNEVYDLYKIHEIISNVDDFEDCLENMLENHKDKDYYGLMYDADSWTDSNIKKAPGKYGNYKYYHNKEDALGYGLI